MSSAISSSGRGNRLLAALPEDEYQRLLPSLELITLELRDSLYEKDQPIEYVFFPLSGMASILAILNDNTFIEVGIVGNEGMVGLPVFLGAEKTTTTAFYQVIGKAVRMRSDLFRAEIQRNGTLASLLQRYTQAFLALVAQNSACNSQHTINQRCARWLLSVHDRIGNDQFHLTQEFISQMLGVRRAGVSLVMQTLQEAGYIRYSRGNLTVVDRTGLEKVACECYGVVAAEYRRVLG